MTAENDAIWGELLKDVKDLHKASTAVSNEVKEHLTIADRLQDALINAKDKVKQAVKGVDKISGATTSSGHIWFLFLLAIFVCFFIWMLLKLR